MHWGSSGNNGFGVAASAYDLSSRDENATFYYYQEPTIPSTASPLGVSQSDQARRTKKTPDKRNTRRSVRGKTRPLRLSRASLNTEEAATDSPEVRPPIIVCAGKSPYGSASGNNVHVHNDTNQWSGEFSGRVPEDWRVLDSNDSESNGNNRSLPARSRKILRPEEHSPPRQRTDEELEKIIRDLRGQVFQQQQKQNIVQRDKSASRSHNAEGNDTHQRKHLKNPVEKMEGAVVDVPVAASIGSSFASTNDFLLQRPLSSSSLNRFVSESTAHLSMVVPAIIHNAPPATVQADSRLTSSCDSQSSAKSSRPGSNSCHHPGDNLSLHIGDMAQLNPRLLRSKKFAGSTRTRKEKEPERYLDRHERPSDNSESFLYLVDVDDSEDGPESLSPVGPWVVEDFSLAGTGTTTPRSPSISTCYSISSFGSEDIDSVDGAETSNSELTTLSPRSRLLYFSACADDREIREIFSPLPQRQILRRSTTYRSGLIAGSKLPGPKRCSSAKSTTRARSRPGSSSTGQKQQTITRVHQTRKRPQSVGAASSRSSRSDGASRSQPDGLTCPS